ncbi:TPA: hypothetical protein ENX78_05430 [Candidatus Poribacteria bacterium]|nr:hypothetical protein [Candidatus Poribacteria bacterium]
MGFGLNLTGFNVVNYFARHLDNLLIGRFLGSSELGVYSLAYRIMLFPLQNVSGVIGRVMFPALSVVQEDKAKVRDVYIRSTRLIAFVTFPISVVLLVLAPQFVRIVFGEKWERVIFIIQILSAVGLIQSIATTVGWIYQSQGRTDIMFKWGIFATTSAAVSFAIGLKWNIEGVAVAYAICSFLLLYPSLAIPFRLIGLKFRGYIMRLGSTIIATILMGMVGITTRVILEKFVKWGDYPILFATLPLCAVSYFLTIALLDKMLINDCIRAMKALWVKME